MQGVNIGLDSGISAYSIHKFKTTKVILHAQLARGNSELIDHLGQDKTLTSPRPWDKGKEKKNPDDPIFTRQYEPTGNRPRFLWLGGQVSLPLDNSASVPLIDD